MPPVENPRLFGQIAIRFGWISQQELDECLALQQQEKTHTKLRKIGQILCSKAYLSMLQITDILQEQANPSLPSTLQMESNSVTDDSEDNISVFDEIPSQSPYILESSEEEVATNINLAEQKQPHRQNNFRVPQPSFANHDQEEILIEDNEDNYDTTSAKHGDMLIIMDGHSDRTVSTPKNNDMNNDDATGNREEIDSTQNPIISNAQHGSAIVVDGNEIEEVPISHHENIIASDSNPPNDEACIPDEEMTELEKKWRDKMPKEIKPDESFGVSPIGDAIDLELNMPQEQNVDTSQNPFIANDSNLEQTFLPTQESHTDETDLPSHFFESSTPSSKTKPVNFSAFFDTTTTNQQNIEHGLSQEEQQEEIEPSLVNNPVSAPPLQSRKTRPLSAMPKKITQQDEQAIQFETDLGDNFFSALGTAPIPNIDIQQRSHTAGEHEATVSDSNHLANYKEQQLTSDFSEGFDIPEVENKKHISIPTPQISAQDSEPAQKKLIITAKKDRQSFRKATNKRTRSAYRQADKGISIREKIILGAVFVFVLALIIGIATTKNSPPQIPQNRTTTMPIKEPVVRIPEVIAPNTSNDDVEHLYQQGIQLQEPTNRANDIDAALIKFNRILNELKIEYKESRLYRAECYLAQDQVNLALQDISFYLKNNPPTPRSYVVQAHCREKQKNIIDEQESYRLALTLNPKYPDALRGMAKLCRRQGKFPESLSYAKQAIQEGDIFANAELNATRKSITSQIHVKDDVEAQRVVSMLQAAIQYDPEFKEYHYFLACFLWQNDPKQSLELIQSYLSNTVNPPEPAKFIVAVDLYLYCLWATKNYTQLEQEARAVLTGEQRYIYLASILAMSAIHLDKEQKKGKNDRRNYKSNALIFYSVFYRIYIARNEFAPNTQELEPWLWAMAKEIQNSLGNDGKIVKDTRYIKRLIEINLVVYPPRNLTILEGDIITKINDQYIFSFDEFRKESRRLKTITIQRNDKTTTFDTTEFSMSVLEKANFKHIIKLAD